MIDTSKEKNKEIPSFESRQLEYKIDIASQVLERNIRFVNSCDNKTSIILTAIGVLLTLIVTNEGLYEIVETIKKCVETINVYRTIYLVIFVLAVVIMAIGIFNLGRVLVAKTSEKVKGLNSGYSRIFFSGITRNEDYEEYRKSFCAMGQEELLDELLEQVYINARIANDKYSKYNQGFKQVVIGFILFIIVLVIGVVFF